MVATAVYLLNAFFGDRFERRWTQLIGAILFAGGWCGMYEVHSTAAVVRLATSLRTIGVMLWLWSMYVYIPQQLPDPDARRWAPAGPTAWATSAPGAAS